MAAVEPFRAMLYAHDGVDITPLVAPPYDVIDDRQRDELLSRDPHNVVALELPEGPLDPSAPDNRYETGARRWQRWLVESVLAPDETPAVYVIEQSWTHEGIPIRRRGFVGAVELQPFSAGVILPHERTLPKAIADRLELTRACKANLSQVFGLYSDPEGATDVLLDAAMAAAPSMTATDDAGVLSRVWAIRDAAAIAALQGFLEPRQVFIADGHHRYTTALAYRDERRAAQAAEPAGAADAERAGAAERPAYDLVMMMLVNMDDPGLLVLPTHRVARASGAFDAAAFWDALGERFSLTPLSGHATEALAGVPADVPAFVVKTAHGDARLAMLRAGLDPAALIGAPHGADWKRLDVAVLQELVLKPLLGIHPDEPATLERLSFVKDTAEALTVPDGDVAFILRSTRMDQLRAVALGGDVMPQKSTYFYPKLLSGLLMRSLA